MYIILKKKKENPHLKIDEASCLFSTMINYRRVIMYFKKDCILNWKAF